MNKERTVAFSDAVLAIIITILILELDKPAEMTFEGLWELRESFFAYFLSFFWIGSVWIAMTVIWEKVERINMAIIWWNLVFLFFFSFLPYATGLVSNNYESHMAQAFYGVVVIAANGSHWVMNKLLDKPNSDNEELLTMTKEYRKVLLPDIIIKIIALILTMTVYPASMMYGVLISAVYVQVAKLVMARKWKKKHRHISGKH